MPWPSGSDYQTAVQNPKTAFMDPELQDCSVRPGAMGMPWVASGNFASVFCLVHPNGQKFAARVFNRQVTVQKDRYKAVSNHLGGIVFPFMVAFEYQEQGIQISGQWYPIIKMGWVDGVQFGKAVEDNASNLDVLRYMAAQLRGVNSGLEGNQMSHCDLQHGNIMVSPQGDLILVDYDDCFVPSLAGEQAIALGMPNYQHPSRGAGDFNEHIDHFSALVIYMSLGALAADSSLFNKHNNGDNLVLKESDYKDMNAPAWIDLAHSPERVVVEMTDIIRQACKDTIDKCPSLEEVIKQTGALPAGKRPVIQAQPITTPPVTLAAPVRPQAPTTTTSPVARPIAILPVSQKNFGQIVEGTTTPDWNMEVKNDRTANADLIIQSVIASDPHVSVSYNPQPVKPGDNFFITIRFDLTGVSTAQPARITETVTIDTNDKQLVVAVICDVVPTPKPALAVPGMHTFGDVLIGSQGNWELEIRNTGQGDLLNLSVLCPDKSVRIIVSSQTIPAGGTEKVAIVFEPSSAGDFDTMVTVSGSNAPAQQVRLVGHVVDKGIRKVTSVMVGVKNAPVAIEGVGFEKTYRYGKIMRPVTTITGSGGNRQTVTEYKPVDDPQTRQEMLPTVSTNAPVVIFGDIQFVSPALLRTEMTVPANCPAGSYDIIVTNPDGTQITGKGILVIQPLPTGQIRCPHCNGLTTSTKWCDKCGLPLRSSVLQRV